jgi:hypothetical protein
LTNSNPQVNKIVQDFEQGVNSTHGSLTGDHFAQLYQDIHAMEVSAQSRGQFRCEMNQANRTLMAEGYLPRFGVLIGADDNGHIITEDRRYGIFQQRDTSFQVVNASEPSGACPETGRHAAGNPCDGAPVGEQPQPGSDQNPPATEHKEQWGSRQFDVQPDGSAKYTVTSGDTVWDVATDVMQARLGHQPSPQEITGMVNEIAQASGLTTNGRSPDLIYPNDTLVVPPADAGQAPGGPNPSSDQPIPPAAPVAPRPEVPPAGPQNQPPANDGTGTAKGADAAINFAETSQGNWYMMCLGLVNQAYQHAGRTIPELQAGNAHQAMLAFGDRIQHSGSPPRGALVFYDWVNPDNGVNEGHVGISLGNGQMVGSINGPAGHQTGDRPIGQYAGWVVP